MKQYQIIGLLIYIYLNIYQAQRLYYTLCDSEWQNSQININGCSPCPPGVYCFCAPQYDTICNNKKEGSWIICLANILYQSHKDCPKKTKKGQFHRDQICKPNEIVEFLPNKSILNKQENYKIFGLSLKFETNKFNDALKTLKQSSNLYACVNLGDRWAFGYQPTKNTIRLIDSVGGKTQLNYKDKIDTIHIIST